MPTLRDDRARQGPKGLPVVYVLVGSLVFMGLCMVALLTWNGSKTPDQPSRGAAQESIPGSTGAASNPTNRIAPANPAYPAATDATTSTKSPGTR